jgi:hypothetical protein
MKIVVLYRPNSEYGRITEDFVRDFQSRHSTKLELQSLDTREGDATASLYDVMEYPAILIIENDGYLTKIWQGPSLPRMDDIASYSLS